MVLSEVMSGVLTVNLGHVVWHIAYYCVLCVYTRKHTTCLSKSVLQDVRDDYIDSINIASGNSNTNSSNSSKNSNSNSNSNSNNNDNNSNNNNDNDSNSKSSNKQY